MFAFVSAFAAAGYIFSVLALGLFIVCAFDKPITRDLFAGTFRKYLFIIEVASSGVTESAIHLIVLKLILIRLVGFFGGFSKVCFVFAACYIKY